MNPEPVGDEDVMCYLGNGENYMGTEDKTFQDYPCIEWKDSESSWTDIEGNFCRNPDGDSKPWCHYMNEDTGDVNWSYCAVPSCDEY